MPYITLLESEKLCSTTARTEILVLSSNWDYFIKVCWGIQRKARWIKAFIIFKETKIMSKIRKKKSKEVHVGFGFLCVLFLML